MTYVRIALSLLALGMLSPTAAEPSPESAAVIDIVALNEHQLEDARWALARFKEAGLELPSLSIVFHDDFESCGMREGVLRVSDVEVVVHECQSDRGRARRSLLHELAHAWDHVGGGTDSEVRQRFMAVRGVTSWDDDGLEWNRRGEEQAAEIVAWGLMLVPAPIPTSVGKYGPQDEAMLSAAFEALTGSVPLFGSP